jgi:UDP-N-acetylglucosamine--N-acetylmuramyl-(pentapeptide) pyrophosphoryl-undecaprenol N-acetylglucosamine transferase
VVKLIPGSRLFEKILFHLPAAITSVSKQPKYMIAGGGTGGHIFPALAIAGGIRNRIPQAELLFVGADGRMEMTRVPDAGYAIVGLPIAGLQRRLALSNFSLPVKLFTSLVKAIALVREFRPNAIVGVGGYASAPLLLAARILRIPYLIQEQNSFAGLTNKLLGKGAASICVAFEGMEKYFPSKKIHLTGNPVRKDLLELNISQYEALKHFGLQPGKPTILVIGGSLGARTINEAVAQALPQWQARGYQLIWQTGKAYAEKAEQLLLDIQGIGLITRPFISEMNFAYAAADVVVSRAGALSLAEICMAGKASILVPSPNVAEDHQTRNAESLIARQAARMIRDRDAVKLLGGVVEEILGNPAEIERIGMAAHALAKPDAGERIVDQILNIQKR